MQLCLKPHPIDRPGLPNFLVYVEKHGKAWIQGYLIPKDCLLFRLDGWPQTDSLSLSLLHLSKTNLPSSVKQSALVLRLISTYIHGNLLDSFGLGSSPDTYFSELVTCPKCFHMAPSLPPTTNYAQYGRRTWNKRLGNKTFQPLTINSCK